MTNPSRFTPSAINPDPILKVVGSLHKRGDLTRSAVWVTGSFRPFAVCLRRAEDRQSARCRNGRAPAAGAQHSRTIRDGGRITVAPSTRALAWLTAPFRRLRCTEMEGDEVELSYMTVDRVRGSMVRIGPGCRIGEVRYSATSP